MGELVKRPSPPAALEWTGERLTSDVHGDVEVEHYHRYLLARDLCRSLDVLDIACGEGYGSALLAQTARSVVGVDLSSGTTAHAARSYASDGLHFVAADATAIPLHDSSVDVVVSFETLEHFYDHDAFMREARRVLRPDGFLLLSTPDLSIYSPASEESNPFHVRELTRREFEELLARHFEHVAIVGQRMVAGSVIDGHGSATDVRTFERHGSDAFESSSGVVRAKYLVGLGAARTLPSLPASVFIETSDVEQLLGASRSSTAFEAESVQMRAALDEAGSYARDLEQQLRDARATVTALEAERADRARSDRERQRSLDEAAGYARDLERQIADKLAELDAVDAERAELERRLTDLEREQVPGLSEQLGLIAAELHQTQDDLYTSVLRSEALRQRADALVDEIAELRRQQEADASTWAESIAAAHQREAELETALALGEAERDLLHVELEHVRLELRRTTAENQALLTSTSWRLTGPLRGMSERHPRLRNFLARQIAAHPRSRRIARRILQLLWWTVTLQVPRRVADAVRARRARRALVTAPGPESAADAVEAIAVHVDGAPPTVATVVQEQELLHDAATPSIADEHGDGVEHEVLDPREELIESARTELADFLASSGRLSFVRHDAPQISIVVVAWNAAHLTLRCLRALEAQAREPGCPSFELIIVDNASTDETPALLGRVAGARIVVHPTNCGFVDGSNNGAELARGEALLLLNSDAFVRPGALAAALEALHAAPDVGAVGARLVTPDGVLQEAGSIVWADGATDGYCRDAPPETGEAMFRREVDYCSGAFLLTPLALYRDLGGLDTAYAPAYYDDVDYCFRVAERGLSVVYEPFACVDHVGGGSESAPGDAASLAIRNTKIFRSIHSERLRTRSQPAHPSNALFARSARRAPLGRLLFIDNEVPFATLGSGYPRASAMITVAAEAGWDVTVYGLHQSDLDWERVRGEFPRDVEFIVDRLVGGLFEFLHDRRGFYDTVVVSRPDNMKIVDDIVRRDPTLLRGVRTVYDAEALFARRSQRRAVWFGEPHDELEAAVDAEISLAAATDAVICVTEQEASAFRARLDSPVEVVSHSVAVVADAPGFESRRGILFVGRLLDQTAPNWVGLSWFVRDVWPLIRQRLAGARLDIVGHVDPQYEQLLGPGIFVHGPADDLAPVFARARVFVAPVHFAAGLPLKVVDAAAHGVPTVGTSLMAELLGWSAPKEIRAEDDPLGFAQAVVDLHEDPEVWRQQAERAIERVQFDHDIESFSTALLSALSPSSGARRPCDDERLRRVNEVWGRRPPTEDSAKWAAFPMSHPTVVAITNRRATGDARVDCFGALREALPGWGVTVPVGRTASLCCGTGAVERALVQQGLLADCIGYDASPDAIEQARRSATGMPNLRYVVRDLDRAGLHLDDAQLELIVAHHALHHIERLEELALDVRRALRPGGVFHVVDFVGPTRFQWSDLQIDEMTAWLTSLPERYVRTPTGAVKRAAGRATIDEMIRSDPSEAVRSAEIERVLHEHFEILETRDLGGTLLMMALADIAQNFDPDDPQDRAHIERLAAREQELITAGTLGSDFKVIVARRPLDATTGP